MNLNLLGYAIYFVITAVIILKVGNICYKNGNIFVAQFTPGQEAICLRLNQILLVAYYLLNIGYCLISIIGWQTIHTTAELLEVVAHKSAVIICIIAVLHYLNIFLITRYIQKIIHSF